MASSKGRILRAQTTQRLPGPFIPAIRTEFYREEFLKHQQYLQSQRDCFSEGAISGVETALGRVLSNLDQLCSKANADQIVSRLLHQFDSVTRLSLAENPANRIQH